MNICLETERLIIREFEDRDLDGIYAIMKKPEVMYAWEHGFTLDETRAWLVQQQERYQKNNFGYFAVLQKATGAIIGQAGLINSDIEGVFVTQIGYIFDNSVWGNGYANEAAGSLVKAAFNTFGINKLYCTMRPENLPSVKVAERLGFCRVGEYIKVYNGKEMPHLIYMLEDKQAVLPVF